MKSQMLLLAKFTAAAFVMVATLTAHTESWQMILPSPSSGGTPGGEGCDVLIDPYTSSPAPAVLLATEKPYLQGKEVSILRLTPTDAFSTEFTMEKLDGGLHSVSRLAYKHGDGLYAVGHGTVSKRGVVTKVWKTRWSRDADQGNPGTWQDNDSFLFSNKTSNYGSSAEAIAADNNNVYVCGYANDGTANHWIVRKKASSGKWSTVLDVKSQNNYSQPYGMCFVPQIGNNPAAAVFAVGILNDRWTVLRSLDQGASWLPVGSWPADGSLATARDVASDSNGNIYVVGVRGRDGINQGWVLRGSSDGGTTWEDLLDQPSQLDSWAVRLAIDGADNITLAGAIDDANSSPRWAVVRNRPGQPWSGTPTASWESKTFPLGENTSSTKGRGMVTDSYGNMFLTGVLIGWTDPEDGTFYSGTRASLLRKVP